MKNIQNRSSACTIKNIQRNCAPDIPMTIQYINMNQIEYQCISKYTTACTDDLDFVFYVSEPFLRLSTAKNPLILIIFTY